MLFSWNFVDDTLDVTAFLVVGLAFVAAAASLSAWVCLGGWFRGATGTATTATFGR